MIVLKLPLEAAASKLFRLGVLIGSVADEYTDDFSQFTFKGVDWELVKEEIRALLPEGAEIKGEGQ